MDQLTTPTQDDEFDACQRINMVEQLIKSMPEVLRISFLLRRVEGRSYKDIAFQLDASVSTVEKRVASALLYIYSGLKAKGYDPIEFGSLKSLPYAANQSCGKNRSVLRRNSGTVD